MPALVKRSVGSFAGISEELRTTRWPRPSKYFRKASRVSLEFIVMTKVFSLLEIRVRSVRAGILAAEDAGHGAAREAAAQQRARHASLGTLVGQDRPGAPSGGLARHRVLVEPRKGPLEGFADRVRRDAAAGQLGGDACLSEEPPLGEGRRDIIGQRAVVEEPARGELLDRGADLFGGVAAPRKARADLVDRQGSGSEQADPRLVRPRAPLSPP